MRFQPKTEEEVTKVDLLKVGEGEFTVTNAIDTTSKVKPDGSGGNPMIEVTLEVFDADGETATIKDYLLEATAKKLRHFCYAVGLGDEYERGAIEADNLIGCGGKCVIGIERAQRGSGYPDRSRIADYVPQNGASNGHARPHAASASQQAPAAATSPKMAAWQLYLSMHPNTDEATRAAGFRKKVGDLFPGKTALSDADWVTLAKHLRTPPPPPANPIGDEPQFKEDDIPF